MSSPNPALPLSLPSTVIKRDGSQARFDGAKIRSAIERAGRASGEFGSTEAERLSRQVTKVLTHRSPRREPPGIEQIQDLVEQVLIGADHLRTARAYIVYREKHQQLRQDRRTLVDVAASVNEYLERADWRVNANANQG
jgi:ribonucleoside-triphosphate reductase